MTVLIIAAAALVGLATCVLEIALRQQLRRFFGMMAATLVASFGSVIAGSAVLILLARDHHELARYIVLSWMLGFGLMRYLKGEIGR